MQTNNKLREALMQIYDRVNSLDENCGVDPVEIRDIARAALAEPVRNYEVGTAGEWDDRFRRYCNSRGTSCGDCPLYKYRLGECRFAWLQMPYGEKEGGAE